MGKENNIEISKPSQFKRDMEDIYLEELHKPHPDFCTLVVVHVSPENLPYQEEVENLLNWLRILHAKDPKRADKLRNAVKKRQPHIWEAVLLYTGVCRAFSSIHMEALDQEGRQLKYEHQKVFEMIEKASARSTKRVKKALENIFEQDFKPDRE